MTIFSFLSIPNFIERYGCILLLFSCLFMFLHELTLEDSVMKFTYYILWPFWIYVYLKIFNVYAVQLLCHGSIIKLDMVILAKGNCKVA